MDRRPALLLLAVLLGGLGAAWADAGHHAAEWAEGRASHAAGDAHGDGDRAATPCDGASLGIDCAVCAGLSGAVAAASAVEHALEPEAREKTGEQVRVETRHRATLARGPPAAA